MGSYSYFAQRAAWLVFMAAGISFLVFMTMHFAPGDPARLVAGQDASQETVELVRQQLQLDRPLLVQYGSYISRAMQGDLGRSLHSRTPVIEQLRVRLPITLQLAAFAFVIALIVGVLAGIVSAVYRNTWLDQLSMVLSFVATSMPVFWLGLLLMLYFSIQLRWFPVEATSGFASLVLPAVTLGLRPAATIAQLTRNALLEVLHEDYIRTARAKGVSERSVIFKHALRNALITVITAVGVLLGGLLAGSVVVEVVFGLPGLGDMLISSIMNRDFPMVQAPLLFIAITFTLITTVVDMLYGVIDPTIRHG